jgi:hypothetical protein
MSSGSAESEFKEGTPFEGMLAALRPAASRLDRERTMFLAGEARGKRQAGRGVFWPAFSCVLMVVAVVESGVLAGRLIMPGERSERVAGPLPLPSSMPGTFADEGQAGLAARDGSAAGVESALRDRRGTGLTVQERLSWQVMRYGLDGLPPVRRVQGDGESVSGANVTRGAMMQREVGLLLGTGGTT